MDRDWDISVDHVTFELETHFVCFISLQIKDEMGAAVACIREKDNFCAGVWWENMKVRDDCEDLGIDEMAGCYYKGFLRNRMGDHSLGLYGSG